MKRLALLLTVAGLALAQDKGTPAPAPIPRTDVIHVIEIKQADVNEISTTVNRVIQGLATVTSDQARHLLIVRGSPEAVAVVEELARRMDVAPAPRLSAPAVANVELTVHLLYGSVGEAHGDPVPPDLATTVKQLTALFPYKSYRVLESFVLRGRDGQTTEINGSLPNSNSIYNFRFRPFIGTDWFAQNGIRTVGDAPRPIRLDDLRLGLRLMNEATKNFVDASIVTGLDTRDGQKVVVGKSNVSGTADAIILVVSPKIVE